MQILQHAPGRYIVEGSKGQAYHVKRIGLDIAESIIGPVWECDCWGFIFGHECRHIKAVKAKVWNESRGYKGNYHELSSNAIWKALKS